MGEIPAPFFFDRMIPSLIASSKPRLFTGRIQPTGKAGYAPVRESKNPTVNSSDLTSSFTDDEEFDIRQVRLHGADSLRKSKGVPEFLGLSNVPNSHKTPEKRSPRGSKGLTAHGRDVIRNSCEYLDWRFGSKNLSFLTVTLPTVSEEENAAIVEKWGDITRTFFQAIGRLLHAKNLPNWIVGCYEIQPQRYEESGIAVLHIHCSFVGRKPYGSWAVTPRQARKCWRSAVVSSVPSLANRDFSASENLQRVRTRLGSYMAKYMSKGFVGLGDVAAVPRERHPSSWYTCTRVLSRICNRSVRSGRYVGEFLESLDREGWLFLKPIESTDSSGYRFIVGWAGQLKPGWSIALGINTHHPQEESDDLLSCYKFRNTYHDGFSYISILSSVRESSQCNEEGLHKSGICDLDYT